MIDPHDLLLHYFHLIDVASPWTSVLLHDALEDLTHNPPKDCEEWKAGALQALCPMIKVSSKGNLGFYQGDFSNLLCRPYNLTLPVVLHPNKAQTSSSLVQKIRLSLAWEQNEPVLGDPASPLGSSRVVEYRDRKVVSLIVRNGSAPTICELRPRCCPYRP
jgi:hypothetical protein